MFLAGCDAKILPADMETEMVLAKRQFIYTYA